MQKKLVLVGLLHGKESGFILAMVELGGKRRRDVIGLEREQYLICLYLGCRYLMNNQV